MDMFDKALTFATSAHKGQYRKVSQMEMIHHPISVAKMLSEANFPTELVVAGLLHDTVEDTGVTEELILEEFGPKVAFLVKGNTEDKSKSWVERKQHTIDSIKDAPLEVKALIVADKLDNLRSLVLNYEVLGDKLWEKFNKGYELQKWYFHGVKENAFIGLDDGQIPLFFYDYEIEVNQFFK